MPDLPTLPPTDTPAEIIANAGGDTRQKDALIMAARKKQGQLFDIAFRAVCDAALAGNVTCKNALGEMLILCPPKAVSK